MTFGACAARALLKLPNCAKGCKVEVTGGNGWEPWLGQSVNAGYKKWLRGEQEKIQQRIELAIAAKREGP